MIKWDEVDVNLVPGWIALSRWRHQHHGYVLFLVINNRSLGQAAVR